VKKSVSQITFYFAEEVPGRGSEGIRENLASTVLIFSSFLEGFHNKCVAWILCPFLM